jgi:SAM-dependent methyltransferase
MATTTAAFRNTASRLVNRVGNAVHRAATRSDPRTEPWPDELIHARSCNVCGWSGDAFIGVAHSESAQCLRCGSVARDRYLYWCWTATVPYDASAKVLETSPRLDHRYRQVMKSRVRYLCSDFDERAHAADMHLDIQDLDLASDSIDVILTPHVLEHVPDTTRSLAELYRVLKPGGSMFLLIPMPQGVTAPPTEPEFHGDNTPVFWRFGWDLRDKLTDAGFRVRALVPQDLIDRLRVGTIDSGYPGSDVDEVDLLSHVDPTALTAIADHRDSVRYGFVPDLLFVCWEGVKPKS